MKRPLFFFFITLFITLSAFSADPTATEFSYDQCLGSARPYPVPENVAVTPDSLTPVLINHVGRHGSRFPASASNAVTLRHALLRADSLHTITPSGRKLLDLTTYIIDRCHNHWGALDSLGMAEQRGIASRMFINFPTLFNEGTVQALSSYSPRCLNSMYEFTHQLDRLNNNVEIYTSAGRQNSPLMRPFDTNRDFTDFIRGKVWETPYNDYAATQITAAPLRRILGDGYDLQRGDIATLAMAEYHFLISLPAMGEDVDLSAYFTKSEINALWSCFNLKQYLQRSSSVLSSVPAEIASPLLLDMIRTTEAAIDRTSNATVRLRFGHAETLLPLLSLLRLQGCYYLTNYYDTVRQHFHDFDIIPMAANLQMILFKTAKGKYYVRFDLNEWPIPLIPNDTRIYIPWTEARNYMIRCLPLIDQP